MFSSYKEDICAYLMEFAFHITTVPMTIKSTKYKVRGLAKMGFIGCVRTSECIDSTNCWRVFLRLED